MLRIEYGGESVGDRAVEIESETRLSVEATRRRLASGS
jgi:hypothetical protein